MKYLVFSTAIACCLTAGVSHAGWQEEIGFTRLQALAGADLPTGSSQGLTQVEGSISDTSLICDPDITNPAFTGKTFYFKPAATGTSWHATSVATIFYGTTSLIPGAADVDLYNADNWLGTGFLHVNETIVPNVETRAVQNHSWIGSVGADDNEANQRIDFAIDRDGFVCVVGENNENSTTLPGLLGQSYHAISVGRDDGAHSAGFTTLDSTGRIKPDIVAPSSGAYNATSWTTPMVASTAGLLYSKLAAAPYSLTGADKPRVIKALLLASATKNTVTGWANTSSRPLDLRYGAGELNAYHAYSTLRSGRVTASDTTTHTQRGWAAALAAGNSSTTYFFNIPAGAPSTPFSAALTWHRNVQTSLSGRQTRTWSATLANLNLHLYHASGYTLGSLVSESLSPVDNVELVYQSALAPGNYALVVENTSAAATSFALAWHSLPAVTVAATISTAREIDGQAGVITITRTGDTALPLYVPLILGGTAISGTHYAALPASVTIPAGQSTTTLQITPVSDDLAQGTRTVSVAIAADFALVRDAAQSASVTLEDKPFDAWRFANFTPTELASPTTSGESADPDFDHLANLIEYALNLPPKSPDPSPVSMLHIDGYLALSAGKNATATDIIWAAEVSGNLTSWTPAEIVPNEPGDPPNQFKARDTVPATTADKRFIRLKISRP